MANNLPEEPSLVIHASEETDKKKFFQRFPRLSVGLLLILLLAFSIFSITSNRFGKFWERKTPAEIIGPPQNYKPADSSLDNYYKGLVANNSREEYGSPDIKQDSQGNFLSPIYPKGTILEKLNSIDPISLPGPSSGDRSRDDSGWLRSKREVVNKYLVLARQDLEGKDITKAKEHLTKAIAELVHTDFEGVPLIKPKAPEEEKNFEKYGKSRGVPEVWLEQYFDSVKVLNSL